MEIVAHKSENRAPALGWASGHEEALRSDWLHCVASALRNGRSDRAVAASLARTAIAAALAYAIACIFLMMEPLP